MRSLAHIPQDLTAAGTAAKQSGFRAGGPSHSKLPETQTKVPEMQMKLPELQFAVQESQLRNAEVPLFLYDFDQMREFRRYFVHCNVSSIIKKRNIAAKMERRNTLLAKKKSVLIEKLQKTLGSAHTFLRGQVQGRKGSILGVIANHEAIRSREPPAEQRTAREAEHDKRRRRKSPNETEQPPPQPGSLEDLDKPKPTTDPH